MRDPDYLAVITLDLIRTNGLGYVFFKDLLL